MSEPIVPSARRKFSTGQIVMIVVGAILLLPGLCTLIVVVGTLKDWNSNDPFLGAALTIWGISLRSRRPASR